MVKKKPKHRAWRKANIEDVEEALEDDRLVDKLKRQAEKGKAATGVSDLFTVDTTGSSQPLVGTSRRAAARAKVFPPKAPNIGLSASEEAKVSRAAGQLEASRTAHARGRAQKQLEAEPFDLWATPSPAAQARAAVAKADLAASTVRRAPQKGPARAPKTLHQKVSAAPAVLPAHEGQSVNPENAAFEELVCLAASKQLEQEREAQSLERHMQPLTHELIDSAGADVVKEMDAETKVKTYRALVCTRGDAETREDKAPIKVSKRFRIKSQAKRNRDKKRKVLDAKQAHARAQRKLEKSVGDIGFILKDMRAKSEWLEGRRRYREEQLARRRQLEATEGVVPKCRRLGRTRFAEEAMVVPEAESSAKGLRAMQLKGGSTAVRERIASIVRRGLLPAPPEASSTEANWRKRKFHKLKRCRKFISPLLRDNLFLK